MLLHFLVGIAITLAALINATTTASTGAIDGIAPTNVNTTTPNNGLNTSIKSHLTPHSASPLIYDPSEDWHDYSTTQVWMGSKATTVGNKVGFELYSTVATLLNKACPGGPSNGERRDCDGAGQWLSFDAKCLVGRQERVEDCVVTLWITGRYHSDKIRRNLIVAAAGALQAFTSVKSSSTWEGSNCYDPPSEVGKMCFVGDTVRVNFPDQRGQLNAFNYIHIKIDSTYSVRAPWGYDCCRGEGRENVDRLMENIEEAVDSLFPWMAYREWFVDARCVANGWDRCP